MNIIKALVLRTSHGPDKIYLYTDLPAATFPFDEDVHLDLSFTAARGTGEKYLSDNLPDIPVEVMDATRPRLKLSNA